MARWDSMRKLGHKQWFANVMKHVAPRVDRTVIKLSGGRLRTGPGGPVPTCLLTHTGRKTGRYYEAINPTTHAPVTQREPSDDAFEIYIGLGQAF